MNSDDCELVRTFMHQRAGVVLEPAKDYLIEARLQTLAHREKLASSDAVIAVLRANPDDALARKVLDALLMGETSFFRDGHLFETLHKTVLPELRAAHREDRKLSFWCGASSSGQEPFSLLMTMAEHCPELLGWDLEFLSTDLCLDALDRARAARFTQLEVNRGLPSDLLAKYFTRATAEWEFHPDLRRRVDFREVNLVRDWPEMPGLDLVLLRNVLSYFDVETKQSVLARARARLRPGGFLVLGATENLANLVDGFETVVHDKTVCYRLRPA